MEKFLLDTIMVKNDKNKNRRNRWK